MLCSIYSTFLHRTGEPCVIGPKTEGVWLDATVASQQMRHAPVISTSLASLPSANQIAKSSIFLLTNLRCRRFVHFGPDIFETTLLGGTTVHRATAGYLSVKHTSLTDFAVCKPPHSLRQWLKGTCLYFTKANHFTKPKRCPLWPTQVWGKFFKCKIDP